ncbi:uncharacterized protein LOC143039744 [Oratosquilla oratoria]|uniref:uncharacterized protein LOC143039744 n=1 Tax=Oratosquilla oratoria TaxID=337810 RepID=UPI003F770442
MRKYGCRAKFTTIVRQFHDGVQDDGKASEAFPVTNGVKQGCVLAPTLFSLMFSAMLSDVFRDSVDGTGIKYRTDGSLFNLKRLRTKTMVKGSIVSDILFADEWALNVASEANRQHSVDKFVEVCNDSALKINTKKTEVMHQPTP